MTGGIVVEAQVQGWKLRAIFAAFDADGDTVASAADFAATSANMADMMNADSRQRAALKDAFDHWWDAVSGGNEQITVQEWVAAMSALDDDRFDEIMLPIVNVMVETVDTDGSGDVSLEEFQRFYAGVGLDLDMAAEAFAHLDRDHDGALDHEEFRIAMREYYLSDDPNAPGSWLMGPPAATGT
ncbi:EF-hand domain-containing protein [Actinomadura opuntiae]|uniref:EF-hand domain-containing protein n=1 Tax=Actinomadura sp. OS1-43 TaxID=604315 RepID=UPI00255B3A0E|nr:EF-hand domain-containing protein [Actinomadura sp. OS1-43]MDL4815019.1 EF-hand domain-containing protein [Actinomadura sp. OS1-43]